MLSADCPGGAAGPAGPCAPRRDMAQAEGSPGEPLIGRVWLSGGGRESPTGFRCQRPGSVWGRGSVAAANGTGRPASPGMRLGYFAGPGGHRSRLSGTQRRKNNLGNDRVCVVRGFAASDIPGRKSANHFSPPNAG